MHYFTIDCLVPAAYRQNLAGFRVKYLARTPVLALATSMQIHDYNPSEPSKMRKSTASMRLRSYPAFRRRRYGCILLQ